MHYEFEGSRQSQKLTFVSGVLIGSAIGAGIGLLFAPRSGPELRARIAHSASSAGHRAAQTIDAGREALQHVRHVAATARQELTSTVRGVEKSFAAVRSAVADARNGRPDAATRL